MSSALDPTYLLLNFITQNYKYFKGAVHLRAVTPTSFVFTLAGVQPVVVACPQTAPTALRWTAPYFNSTDEMKEKIVTFTDMPKPMAHIIHHHARQLINDILNSSDGNVQKKLVLPTNLMNQMIRDSKYYIFRQVIEENRPSFPFISLVDRNETEKSIEIIMTIKAYYKPITSDLINIQNVTVHFPSRREGAVERTSSWLRNLSPLPIPPLLLGMAPIPPLRREKVERSFERLLLDYFKKKPEDEIPYLVEEIEKLSLLDRELSRKVFLENSNVDSVNDEIRYLLINLRDFINKTDKTNKTEEISLATELFRKWKTWLIYNSIYIEYDI